MGENCLNSALFNPYNDPVNLMYFATLNKPAMQPQSNGHALATQTVPATQFAPANYVEVCVIKLCDDDKRFDISVWKIQGGKQMRCDYGSKAVAWLRSLSQRTDTYYAAGTGNAHAAVSDLTCLEVVKQFGELNSPASRILFADQLTELTFKKEIAEIYLSDWVEKTNTAWYEHKTLPEHNFELHPVNPLSEYQQLPLVVAMAQQSFALFMEQGTGKTSTTIAIACNRFHRQNVKRVLVVCPKNVRYNWVAEIKKFATVDCKATVIGGQHYDRQIEFVRSICGAPLTFTIVGYDTIVKHVDWIKELRFDMCIADESHYFKSAKTNRWDALHAIRDTIPFRMILTGSPVGNTPLDLYTQLEFLGQGKSGFATQTAFKKFFGNWESSGASGFAVYEGARNLPILQRRLLRSSFTIRAKEAMPYLPERLYTTRDVYMTQAQHKIYTEVATKLMYEIESQMDAAHGNAAKEAMTIEHILTKLLRLAQITSGFLTVDAPEDEFGIKEKVAAELRVKPIEPNPKIAELRAIYNELKPNSKIVIWACWRQDLKRIAEEFANEFHTGQAVLFYGDTRDDARQDAIRRFNNDRTCRIFLANQAAASTGINLLGHDGTDECETQCDTVVYYSQNWSYLLRDQSEARAHRRGTKSNVQIIDLSVPNTIDEEIRERVIQKKTLSNSLTDVREILKGIREHAASIEWE